MNNKDNSQRQHSGNHVRHEQKAPPRFSEVPQKQPSDNYTRNENHKHQEPEGPVPLLVFVIHKSVLFLPGCTVPHNIDIQKTTTQVVVFCCALPLVLDVWHQCHKASSLYRASEVSLPFRAHVGAASAVHARVWVEVSTKLRNVFVINVVVDGLSLFFFHVYLIGL